jgi:hypothetical protein
MYVPRSTNVRIEFFRAQTDADTRPTPWDKLALAGVELRQVVVPAINHVSMMHEPYVRMLAAEIERALADARRGVAQAPTNGNGSVNGSRNLTSHDPTLADAADGELPELKRYN